MTIKAISSKKVQFTTPLKFWHYGGQNYQAEVGLISRRIVFQGASDSEAELFGGHVLVMGDGRFSGLQLYRMGQQNVLARYPLHFHLAGSKPNSYVKDCSFLTSYYRCVSIHQTNDTQVLRNVAYDVYGFCYYLEEGVEENNDISFNLASYVHTIYGMMRNRLGGQSGDSDYENATQPLPADRAASGFYITNAYNTFVGNAASGGWSGISLPNLPTPLGFSRNWPIVPSSRPTLKFEGNTAHSSGYSWDFGGCIYLGGKLYYDPKNGGLLKYESGRNNRSPRLNNNNVWMRFNNTKTFLCNMGFNHWGDRPEVARFEGHDIERMGQLFGDAWLNTAIINAKSKNPVPFPRPSQGFQFYDTWSKAILTDVIFRNYRHIPGVTDPYVDNTALIGMTHSDSFKPQNLAGLRNIQFQDCDFASRVGLRNLDTGASRYYSLVDFDGSIVGTNDQAYILGSGTSTWWNYDPACTRNADWNVWVCPKGAHEVGVLSIAVSGYIDSSFPENIHIGNTTLWGPNVPAGSQSVITKKPGITGPTGIGWYMYLEAGAPGGKWQMTIDQVPQGNAIYFATPYPAGTTFSIRGYNPYFSSKNTDYAAASSVSDLWTSNGMKYYFDDSHLYLKAVNPWNSRSNFTRDGAYLWNPDSGYNWWIEITASCAATGSFCSATDQLPPQSSWW